MTIEFTARRMTPPTASDHTAISDLRWRQLNSSEQKWSTTEALIEWLDAPDSNRAVVGSGANQVPVGVVRPSDGRAPYLQSYADGKWNNNLLALPLG